LVEKVLLDFAKILFTQTDPETYSYPKPTLLGIGMSKKSSFRLSMGAKIEVRGPVAGGPVARGHSFRNRLPVKFILKSWKG